jgi:hypothetical protein
MSRRIRLLGEIGLALAVLMVAGSIFLTNRVKIDSDEAEWIGTTRYFQLYFVEHDVSAQSWPDEYWTRTQPMVVRYVIGSWLWLRGYDLEALDPTYDYTRNAAENRRAGLGPSDELLADGRMPARALAMLSILTLYLVTRLLAGPAGGLVAATLATGSPYLQEHLVRAKAESTLMFLLFATLRVGVIGLSRAERTERRWPDLGWGIATGILLGLAFGAKLTAILAIMAVALWGTWACLNTVVQPRRRAGLPGDSDTLAPQPSPFAPSPRESGKPGPWLWPLAVLATTGIVFLASNPFLWPNPIGRTWILFDNRREEMARQQLDVPSRAVYGLDRRIELVWDRSVSNDAFGPSRLNWPVEAVLAGLGAGWLAVRACSRRPTALTLAFLWAACIWVGVTAGLGFLLQHYFVPTAMMADLLGGLAAGWVVQTICWLSGRYLPWATLPGRRSADVSAHPVVAGGPSTGPGTVAESG